MSVTIGIDPGGVSGAIACFVDGELLDVIDMPCADKAISPKLLVDALREFSLAGMDDRPTVIVEKVHSMPRDGGIQAFRFGRSLGVIEGCIAGLGWPIEWRTPQAWKKHHGLLRQEKDAARVLAIETWPEHSDSFRLKKHCGRADAALIATSRDRAARTEP